MSSSRTKRSRSNAPSSSGVSPPRVDTLGIKFRDTSQRDSFESLSRRPILATKFSHVPSLHSLGVFEGVQTLFRNVGWGSFLERRADTYIRPTLEFLSSVHMPEKGNLSFRLLNRNYSLTFSHMNQVLGARSDSTFGPSHQHPHDYEELAFWQSITGLDSYESRSAKASHIIHPCLRLAHRIIACTIFARTDAGVVSRHELFILWAMTHPFNPPRNENELPLFKIALDLAAWTSLRFLKVHNASAGEICCGGLITLLAQYSTELPSLPTDLAKADGPSSLDLSTLIRMTMLRPTPPGRHTWLLGPSHTDFMVLPDPARTRVTDRTDWLMTIDQDQAEQQADDQAGSSHTTLHPDILSRLDSLEAHYVAIQGQYSSLDARSARMEAMQNAMYEWHIREGHFPDTRPPS